MTRLTSSDSPPRPTRADEALLVREAMAGDRAAFGALVAHYQGIVYRLCRRYAAGEAEDLAQETFVRAFTERTRFDPTLPLGPWLATIARHLCIDRARRKRPEPDSHDTATTAIAQDASAECAVSSREELALVEKALNALPEGPREAMWLYHCEGLGYSDIARVLDVPIGTVMTWLHRGRLRLCAARTSAIDPEQVAP